jgi:hypothetical protein
MGLLMAYVWKNRDCLKRNLFDIGGEWPLCYLCGVSWEEQAIFAFNIPPAPVYFKHGQHIRLFIRGLWWFDANWLNCFLTTIQRRQYKDLFQLIGLSLIDWGTIICICCTYCCYFLNHEAQKCCWNNVVVIMRLKKLARNLPNFGCTSAKQV